MSQRQDRLLGIISDTHGLLRPAALEALQGVEHIIHAGDVGGVEILEQLREIAPVTAVRGNTDHGRWAQDLPLTGVVDIGGALVYVVHILDHLDIDPEAAGMTAVVFGHSHNPSIEKKKSVLFLNPGSAGPRRFSLPVTVALARVRDRSLEAEIIDLETNGSKRT